MKYKYLLLLLTLVLSLNGFAQISSATADFFEATEYSDSDYVFVFCSDTEDAGQLRANDSTNTGSFEYTWYTFDESTNDFTTVLTGFTINNDSTNSTVTNLADGGYKVVLTKGTEQQEYIAWVYNNNDLAIDIQLHPDNDCDFLAIITDPYLQTTQSFETPLSYYHVDSSKWYTLENKISKYEWSSNPEWDSFNSYNGPYTSIGEDPLDNDSELPTENTIFSVVVTDRFGCSVDDDVDYTAIETDADFSWTTVDSKTEEILESGNSESDLLGPAPLRVRFTNESLNGKDYMWFFGDTLWSDDIDTLKTSDFLEEPEHTYYYTVVDSGKTYTLRMYSTSEYGCVDSIFFDINIEPSVIEFPNVFTPNDDAINDVFKVTDFKSIRSFSITIFNRAGQLVHEYEGDVRDWEGWDGTVKNSSRKAPAGNYFFVVDITGWDNVHYDNDKLSSGGGSQSQETGNEGDTPVGDNQGGGKSFGIVRLFR